MELRLISTTYEGKERITREQTIPFCDDGGREEQLINLYPQVIYQQMDGFGGAITDSAAYIYSLMNPEQKKQMLDEYFGQGTMKYRFVRIPIDSCDFSLSHYEADGDEADASLLCNRLGRPFLCMEDRSEIIVLAPYPVDIRKYYPNLEQDFHGICIAYTMVGREADAFKTAYQQVRNIYVHRLLYPGKNVLCQEDIAGMRTDFTVPHRKIEQMTELTGTAADEALTKRLSELFDRQKLVQYSIGYTLALCDTVYRAMRQTALSIPGGEAVDLERVKSPLTFATMREYLVNVNERLLSLNQLAHTYMQSRNDTYVMELAIQYIRRNYPKPITLAMVSNEVSLNYAYFSTMFSKYTGKTFSEYLRNTRMEKAKELLRQPDISIAEVAAQVGYENYKSFYRAFKDAVGTTPVEYQQKKYRIHREDEKQ